jgi:hypothetical protein
VAQPPVQQGRGPDREEQPGDGEPGHVVVEVSHSVAALTAAMNPNIAGIWAYSRADTVLILLIVHS